VRRQVAVVCAVMVLLAGCTGQDEPVSTGSASPLRSSASPSPDKPPHGTVSADAVYLGMTVHLDVHPLEVKDGVALLTVDFALDAGPSPKRPFAIGQILAPPSGPMGTSVVRLVDFKAGQVYPAGEDAQEQPATTREILSLAPGKSVSSQGFYKAPESSSVGVLFPYFGMVLDVPVTKLAASKSFAVTPAELGREGEITYKSSSLDAFTAAYDDSSSARVEGTAATVALSSDVLFATDQASLTPQAEQVVAAAGAQIASVADGGEVSVVGHTDDVGSDAYNQDLSVRRAQAVAAVLTPKLGGGFSVVPTGSGESEPAVAGTSPEARAANRRVEIAFTASKAGAAVAVAGAAGAPAATGPTGTGKTAVDVPLTGGQVAVRATSVTRHGSYLIGALEVEGASPSESRLLELFGTFSQGLRADRGLLATTLVAGAHNVTLLGTSGRYYPIDYIREVSTTKSDLRRILADQFLSAALEQRDKITVTVVWPDPGGDTVTIDVPGRFRLVDVPVTKG